MRGRDTSGAPGVLLGRLPRGEAVWVADLLRRETAGGGLMLLAAAAGYAEGARLSPLLGSDQVICWALLLSLPVVLPVLVVTPSSNLS